MNCTDKRDRLNAKLAEAVTEGEGALPTVGVPLNRSRAEQLADVADLLWQAAQGAPPLEEDPVAAMLGLVPIPDFTLDQKALTRARKNARLTIGQVSDQLRERGWDVKRTDVFRWENQTAGDVPPALIQALAATLRVEPERLIATEPTPEQSGVYAAVRRSPVYKSLVERWARATNTPLTIASRSLEARMLATVHRGSIPDAEQLLGSLEGLVLAVEQGEKGQHTQ